MDHPPPAPGLVPRIGVGRLILLAFALIAPVTSVLVAFGAAYARAGHAVTLVYLMAAAVSLLVMLCYAEVGSRFPDAGGDYTLAARVLGVRAGRIYAVAFVLKGAVLPAVLCLAGATYLHLAWPGLAPRIVAGSLVAATIGLALISLGWSSAVVGILTGVEAILLVAWCVVTLPHLSHPVWSAVLPRVTPSGMPALLGGAAIALYGYNGPQASLYYSEETRAAPETFGSVIMVVAATTIAVEVLCVVLAMGTLARTGMATATGVPLAGVLSQTGTTGRRVLLTGFALALFDAAVSTLMAYARIHHALARDGLWPAPVSRILAAVTRRGVPAAPTLVLGGANLVVLAFARVNDLVELLGALVLLVYIGIALAGLASRLDDPLPPYRMPFWPVPPLLALGLLVILAWFLPRPQLALSAAVIAAGLLWPRHWSA